MYRLFLSDAMSFSLFAFCRLLIFTPPIDCIFDISPPLRHFSPPLSLAAPLSRTPLRFFAASAMMLIFRCHAAISIRRRAAATFHYFSLSRRHYAMRYIAATPI